MNTARILKAHTLHKVIYRNWSLNKTRINLAYNTDPKVKGLFIDSIDHGQVPNETAIKWINDPYHMGEPE